MRKKLLFGIMLFSVMCSYATRYYVDVNATGTANGTSWGNAFVKIEDAFAASIIGDEIWVSNDVYKPQGNGYTIPSGIKVYGGFVGTETLLSERNLTTNITTLNGDIGTVGVQTDNCDHVVYMLNVNNQTRLDGFRIINGHANNVLNNARGGGLFNNGGSPTIANCTFISNYSKDFGGAICSENGNIRIENCDLNNNTCLDGGAGIYLSQGGTANILRSKINYNSCTYGDAGGVMIGNGVTNVNIDRCEISGNSTQDKAGAISVGDDVSFNMYNSLLIGNVSDLNTIYMSTTFNSSSHNIINCTFSGNKSNNTTSAYSTIIRVNTSTNIYNTILWGNYAPAGKMIFQLGTTTVNPAVNNCIIEGGHATGTNNLNQDPSFVSSGSYSLAPFDSSSYNYKSQNGTISSDNGNDSYVNSLYNFDFDGNNRIHGLKVDIGCYENSFILSTDEYLLEDNFSLYYDAVKREIRFIGSNTLKNRNVKVYNILGQEVTRGIIRDNKLGLPAFLNSGVYLIKIEGLVGKKVYL